MKLNMIKDITVLGNVGFLRTEKQFIFLINGNIHGPWNNEDWEKVIKRLEEKE